MKKIGVLIDFTKGSEKAWQQAVLLAGRTGASLCAIHIVSNTDKANEAEKALEQFVNAGNINVNYELHIETGQLFEGAASAIRKTNVDLAVVCTHGVKGMFQHLFGAHILRLVQALPCPCIVIGEQYEGSLAGINRVLCPVGPNPDYATKVKQTAALASLLGAEVVVYEIDRPTMESDRVKDKNKSEAIEHFEAAQVKYSSVIEEMKVASAGYSRQTMDYAQAAGISLISLMAQNSDSDLLFGKADKENFLVNDNGIPILCCNG